MAGGANKSCWRSKLKSQDGGDDADDTESIKSSAYEDDGPARTPVGPFMIDLFEKQLYTDVDFVSKGAKDAISAHRVVLAAKSDYFEKLLFGEQKDGAAGMKLEVEITSRPFSVFKDVIKYFYTGDIYFPDTSYVLDVYSVAGKLGIPSLFEQCEEYLDALELNEDNVCTTLQVSNEKCAEQLKERCIDYIKKNTNQVISSPDFEKCSFNTVREICDLQDLNVKSEFNILEASTRWLNVQPAHTKNVLKRSLLKCIRFLSLSGKELSDVVRQYPDLLSQKDALAILMYLNDPKSKNGSELPDWVNKGHRTFRRESRASDQKKNFVIPLKPAIGSQELTKLTSVLQMQCTKGSHSINAIKFSFESTSNDGNLTATLDINILVMPRIFKLNIKKTVLSEECTVMLDRGIFVRDGQTFHLKVQCRTKESFRFLKFDDSTNDFASEHFKCSAYSKPNEDRFFFIREIEYSARSYSKSSRRSLHFSRNLRESNQ